MEEDLAIRTRISFVAHGMSATLLKTGAFIHPLSRIKLYRLA